MHAEPSVRRKERTQWYFIHYAFLEVTDKEAKFLVALKIFSIDNMLYLK